MNYIVAMHYICSLALRDVQKSELDCVKLVGTSMKLTFCKAARDMTSPDQKFRHDT